MEIELLGTNEVAEILGYSVQRVRQLAAKKKLTAVKIGNSYCFLPSDVDRFVPAPNGRPPNHTLKKELPVSDSDNSEEISTV